jgi:flagellar FliL protein
MSAPAKPAEAEAPAEGAPRPRRSRLVLLAGALALVLAGGGAGAWFFLHRPAPGGAPKAEAARPPEHVVKLGTVVVNVAGTEGRRFLRATLELGLGATEAKRVEELRAPLVDAAIGVLGEKPLGSLLQPAEREGLRQELRARLSAAAGGRGVTHVFLTEFVVQ